MIFKERNEYREILNILKKSFYFVNGQIYDKVFVKKAP